MSKNTRIVHFTVIDGTQEEITQLGEILSDIRDRVPFDVEFLVTNERVQTYDLKHLINELYKLYKTEKKSREEAAKKVKKSEEE